MLYEIESVSGEKITVSCSDDGTVVYRVGKRKTTFTLADCEEYIFTSCDGTRQTIVCGEDGVDQLFLIMLIGEERLERNNNECESGKHERLDNMTDKYDEIADMTVNVEDDVLKKIDADYLRKAVSQLKPSEQELVQKLYLDEHPLTQAEYARQIGIKEHSVKQKTWRVRQKLRQILEGKE